MQEAPFVHSSLIVSTLLYLIVREPSHMEEYIYVVGSVERRCVLRWQWYVFFPDR